MYIPHSLPLLRPLWVYKAIFVIYHRFLSRVTSFQFIGELQFARKTKVATTRDFFKVSKSINLVSAFLQSRLKGYA